MQNVQASEGELVNWAICIEADIRIRLSVQNSCIEAPIYFCDPRAKVPPSRARCCCGESTS